MATTINPRRKAEGEPRKKAVMPMIRQIDVRDPECFVHGDRKPFNHRFQSGRLLTPTDFIDLERTCSCLMERYEGDGKIKAPKDAKVCTKCHLRRSKIGTCGCD